MSGPEAAAGGENPLVPEWFSANAQATVRLGLQIMPLKRTVSKILRAVHEVKVDESGGHIQEAEAGQGCA